MVAYLNRGVYDVYDLGLDAQAFAARPRAIEAVDPATGVITLTGNGLAPGSFMRFVVEGAAIYGQQRAALAQGLSASIVYTAAPVSGNSDMFQVAPVNGSIITSFGDAGFGVQSIIVDPVSTILAIAANESANVNNCLTGHDPLIKQDQETGLYPDILVGVVARRTAIRAALRLGLANPIYQSSLDKLIEGQEFDNQTLKDWLEGRRILPEVTDQASVPYDAPRARSGRWLGGCCTPWVRRTI